MVDASRCTVERGDPLLHPALGRARRAAHALIAALGCLGSFGCGDSETPSQTGFRTREELLDPATCGECHETHYEEWSGSMHAYAAEDPVFVAMNRRGQEETGGALGAFCVNCHAPMAVREAERAGLTGVDWANFEALPHARDGVSCYFCHNVSSVDGAHNAQLSLSNDVTMRGRFSDAASNPAHASEYSPLLAGDQPESASACGACHDIVLPSPPAPTPAGEPVHLERTFKEWQSSIFAPEHARTPSSVATCAGCHMPRVGNSQVIADGPGLGPLPQRTRHAHTFPAVDVVFPSAPAAHDPNGTQRSAQLAEIQYQLDTTLLLEICVERPPQAAARVRLHNARAGHNWPSGAAQDRRAWVEVNAYRKGELIYTNAAPDGGEPASETPGAWLFRDRLFAGDREVHMFWEADRVEPGTIGVALKLDPRNPQSYVNAEARRRFPGVNGSFPAGSDGSAYPDRVTVRVRMRAMGRDVLDALVQSGHLDPALPAEIPTFDLLPSRGRPGLPTLSEVSLEWSEAVKSSGAFKTELTRDSGVELDCVTML